MNKLILISLTFAFACSSEGQAPSDPASVAPVDTVSQSWTLDQQTLTVEASGDLLGGGDLTLTLVHSDGETSRALSLSLGGGSVGTPSTAPNAWAGGLDSELVALALADLDASGPTGDPVEDAYVDLATALLSAISLALPAPGVAAPPLTITIECDECTSGPTGNISCTGCRFIVK